MQPASNRWLGLAVLAVVSGGFANTVFPSVAATVLWRSSVLVLLSLVAWRIWHRNR